MNHTTPITSVHQRNYGIDSLKLIAAFFVIVLHTINQGGVYAATAPESHQNYLCKLLLIFTICAVNIFGIVSGYVGYRETSKTATLSGYLPIWLSVVFYSVIICAVYKFLFPSEIPDSKLVEMFFPLSKRLYWYFSAYSLLYFFSPYLNRLLQSCSEKELRKLFYGICFVIVPLEYLGKTFAMSSGYSAIWLIVLYLVGAILKKCQIGRKIPTYVLILCILGCYLCYFLLNVRLEGVPFFIYYLSFQIDSSYVSPFYLAPAVFYVILFSRFQFPKPIQRVIAFAVPASLSIYIANVQPQFWNYFMYNHFVSWAHSSPTGILVRTMLFSLGFVAVVVIVDYFRRILFQSMGRLTVFIRIRNILHRNRQS